MTKKISDYQHIVWDWNGTLINDTWLVVEIVNKMLARRNLQKVNKEIHRGLFDFPVMKYYSSIGFDFSKEPFEKLTDEFISEYYDRFNECQLFDEAEKVLRQIKEKGILQSVLSASQQDLLKAKLKQYGIDKYFYNIIGLENHYAESKIEKGKAWMAKLNLQPQEVLLIGDTIHDYDVARYIGCDCLLVADGHHSYERLASKGVEVIKTLKEIKLKL
jgi:phosphoglycolate phosphatase